MSRRRRLLSRLYGDESAAVDAALDRLVAAYRRPRRGERPRWSEADAWLIAYPDQFGPQGLAAVGEVVTALAPALNGVHVLPFHPSSSDGGFAVMDYATVDPAVGTWADVERLGRSHRLMADAVVNHVSARGRWFQEHLAGAEARAGFFRVVPPGTDLSSVTRPRPGPPISPFTRADGTVADYWTTFGADQVDLDYRTPAVLLAVCEAIFRYVHHGATAIRLDAVAFLWKEPGTASVHLPETHAIVAVLRDCLDEIDPGVVIVTETNVAHADNIAYLGTPEVPEAHAVYQFSLAPLVLHALQTGEVGPLRRWARGLAVPPGTTTLNFLASHDGVGVRPARGWLEPAAIADLAVRCREVGGRVNEAAVEGGTEPYELAATWRSLCGAGVGAPFGEADVARRLLATHSVALALQGLPLLYVHSLVGTPNDTARADASGIARDLNRTRFAGPAAFLAALGDDATVAGRVWSGLRAMLDVRRRCPAFHPDAPQRVRDGEGPLLVVERGPRAGSEALVCTNLGAAAATVEVGPRWHRLGSGEAVPARLTLAPWGTAWLGRSGTVSAT